MEYKGLSGKYRDSREQVVVAKITISNMVTELDELKHWREPGWEMKTCKLLSALEMQKAHLKELEDEGKT